MGEVRSEHLSVKANDIRVWEGQVKGIRLRAKNRQNVMPEGPHLKSAEGDEIHCTRHQANKAAATSLDGCL